ncbi:hypothetical protein GCM10029992_07420 [Glycomyces albus]
MDMQQLLRTFLEFFLIGGAIFAYPLGVSLLTDMGTRRLLLDSIPVAKTDAVLSGPGSLPVEPSMLGRIARISAAALLSAIGNGIAAVLIYAAAAGMLILISDRFWWAFLTVAVIAYWAAMVTLSFVSSLFNLAGPDKRHYFPEAERVSAIEKDCAPSWKRERSYELGRFWYLRTSANLTGIVLAVSFLYFPIGLGVYSHREIWAITMGQMLGALTASLIIVRISRRFYARSRALSSVLPDIAEDRDHIDISDSGLSARLDRRSELHVLLRRAAFNINLKRRHDGFKGTRADSIVFLGAARYFKRLGDPDERLSASTPPSTFSALRRLAVALAGPIREDSFRQLAVKVDALGPNGSLDPELSALGDSGIRDRIEHAWPLIRTLAPIVGLVLAALTLMQKL